MIERAADKFDAGMHNVLGGHIEQGEDIIKSAEREIEEESGIRPDKTSLAGVVHVSNFFGKNILMFVTKSYTKTTHAVDSREGILKWVEVSEIDGLNIYEDVRPFLERLQKDADTFIGTSVFDGKGTLLSLDIRDMP